MRSQHASHWQTPLLLACILLVANASPILAQSKHTLTPADEEQRVAKPNSLVRAQWRGRALVGIEENNLAEPLLYTLDKSARFERIRFRIPGAGYIHLADIAGGPDGTIAVVGSAYTSDGKSATFVSRISPDGEHQTVTRVWPYCPRVVTVAQDGVIWTAGWVLDDAGDISAGNVFKRFDKSGRILGDFSVQARSKFQRDAVEYSTLSASDDRVAWLTNANEYIEFSQDGSEIFRLSGPPITHAYSLVSVSLALSETNQAVIGGYGRGQWDIWILDRQQQVWVPVQWTANRQPRWGRVLGFDGQHLVTREGQGFVRRYRIASP